MHFEARAPYAQMPTDDEQTSSDCDEWEHAEEEPVPPDATSYTPYVTALAVVVTAVYISLGMRRLST